MTETSKPATLLGWAAKMCASFSRCDTMVVPSFDWIAHCFEACWGVMCSCFTWDSAASRMVIAIAIPIVNPHAK